MEEMDMRNRIVAMRDRLAEVGREEGGLPRFMGEVSQLLYDLQLELITEERARLEWKVKARKWERDCWAARREVATAQLGRATNDVYAAEQEKVT
jgi:hypothetical protein